MDSPLGLWRVHSGESRLGLAAGAWKVKAGCYILLPGWARIPGFRHHEAIVWLEWRTAHSGHTWIGAFLPGAFTQEASNLSG